MKEEIREILVNGASELGVALEKDQIEQFSVYLSELKEWNKRINLTTIIEDRHIVTRHFLDSMTPLKHLKGCQRLLDLGSGAGFPGIPLKIVRSDISVTLLDAKEKKVLFQRHIIRTLGLKKGICSVHGRAEDLALDGKYKEKFDAVISRALTSLEDFINLGSPFLIKGGLFIAIKSKKGLEETDQFKHREAKLLTSELVRLSVDNRETGLLLYERS